MLGETARVAGAGPFGLVGVNALGSLEGTCLSESMLPRGAAPTTLGGTSSKSISFTCTTSSSLSSIEGPEMTLGGTAGRIAWSDNFEWTLGVRLWPDGPAVCCPSENGGGLTGERALPLSVSTDTLTDPRVSGEPDDALGVGDAADRRTSETLRMRCAEGEVGGDRLPRN
jgi:hypothetical protein